MKEVALFRPYYVCEKRDDPVRGSWVRLLDGYVAEPLGWAAATHLEEAISRYGYIFAGNGESPVADLHDSSKDAYDRLIAQSQGDPNEEIGRAHV